MNEKLNLNPTQDALIQAGIAALETFLQELLSKHLAKAAEPEIAPQMPGGFSGKFTLATPRANPPVVNAGQWADPNGNNLTVDQFDAFKEKLDPWGITVVSSRVQAWAPIEAGSTPGGPGGGFIEGYAPLAVVTNSLLGRTDIPIAIQCQLETFGNGHVISWPFASQLEATFSALGDNPVTDAELAGWLAQYCTPAFSQVNYIATLEVWRAENS